MLRWVSRLPFGSQPAKPQNRPLEVPVSYSSVLEPETDLSLEVKPRLDSLYPETKPHLDSYDSAEECSLEHLLRLYQMVEADHREQDGYVFDDTCLNVA